ncbi:hypothetical protein [Thalassobacillus hwangdonensis]|uniref:ABC-2 type transport system permease protein n=1 Tax=Thalassobacillus hwangdonensis TaxID=546108 RepID=A0ABW3L6S5_9BACI
MFSTEINQWQIIKTLTKYKIRAHSGSFTAMIAIQVLAALFSMGGLSGYSGSSGYINYSIDSYSGNLIHGFMMIWAFMSAVLLTTKSYRYEDFAFVTNRFTSNLSNMLFLGFACVIGGVTTFLASLGLKVIVISFVAESYMVSEEIATVTYLYGLLATILYFILAASLGYLIGSLVQINRAFIAGIPILIFGTVFLSDQMMDQQPLFEQLFAMYFRETSFIFFLVKIVLTIILCFGASTLIMNKMEVRH